MSTKQAGFRQVLTSGLGLLKWNILSKQKRRRTMTEEGTPYDGDVEQEMNRLNTLFADQQQAFRQQPVSDLQQRRTALSRLQQILSRNSEELAAAVATWPPGCAPSAVKPPSGFNRPEIAFTASR
jgi:hypothetical protein